MEIDTSDLERAKHYLGIGDLKASAVYARSALEKRLRKVCTEKAVRVRYRANPKQVSADDLWQGVTARNRENIAAGKTAFIDVGLAGRIDAVRSIVLNELSHSRANSLTGGDLNAAIQAIADLENFKFL